MAEAAGRQKRSRVKLVEVLIGAVCAGGSRLRSARADFERMDPAKGVPRLVLQAVDPDLLEAVVGPRLAPVWVERYRLAPFLSLSKFIANGRECPPIV